MEGISDAILDCSKDGYSDGTMEGISDAILDSTKDRISDGLSLEGSLVRIEEGSDDGLLSGNPMSLYSSSSWQRKLLLEDRS